MHISGASTTSTLRPWSCDACSGASSDELSNLAQELLVFEMDPEQSRLSFRQRRISLYGPEHSASGQPLPQASASLGLEYVARGTPSLPPFCGEGKSSDAAPSSPRALSVDIQSLIAQVHAAWDPIPEVVEQVFEKTPRSWLEFTLQHAELCELLQGEDRQRLGDALTCLDQLKPSEKVSVQPPQYVAVLHAVAELAFHPNGQDLARTLMEHTGVSFALLDDPYVTNCLNILQVRRLEALRSFKPDCSE